MAKVRRTVKKAAISVLGTVVLVIGVIAIPYPGPGWLIVFAGLGILATEFEWAQRLLDTAKGRYEAWQEWLRRQKTYVKVFFWLGTSVVVILTIWLLNGYGIINDLLNLHVDWVRSPLVK